MKKLVTGTVGSANASFVAVYVKGIKPWENKESVPADQRDKVYNAVLMVNRSDGRLGFIGGKVDAGENAAQAVIREAMEEVAYKIKPKKLEEICTHNFPTGPNNTLTSHLYAVEVSMEKMEKIQRNLHTAEGFNVEVMGYNLVLLGEVARGKGLAHVLKSSMASSVPEELAEFIMAKQLVPKEELAGYMTKGGRNLDELLLPTEVDA